MRAKIAGGTDMSAGGTLFREIQRPFRWVPDVRWRPQLTLFPIVSKPREAQFRNFCAIFRKHFLQVAFFLFFFFLEIWIFFLVFPS